MQDSGNGGAPVARGRILGIDVARALAIVGMLAVHIGPTDAQGLAGRVYALPHGRASVLFVLVAGIGVSIMAASRRRSRPRARRELAWRAVLLLLAGLALQALDHRVLVILQTYALLFLVGGAALSWPRGRLLGVAGVALLTGPAVFLAGRLADPGTFDRAAVRFGDGLIGVAHGLLLSGPYPLVVWIVPFLLGMWIGRRDLRSRATQATLLVGGGAVALTAHAVARSTGGRFEGEGPRAWAHLLDATPHSQMPLWLLGACGSAALVLGSSLLFARALPRAAWPLAAMGQLALSIYVGHLLALHAWSGALRSDEVGRSAAVVVAFAVVAAGLSVAWRRLLARGPLEALLRWPPLPGASPTGR